MNQIEFPGFCIHCRSSVVVVVSGGEPNWQQRIPCPYCDTDDGVVVINGLETTGDLAPSG